MHHIFLLLIRLHARCLTTLLVAGEVVGHGNVQVARSLQRLNEHHRLQHLNDHRLVFAPVVAAGGK